MSECMPVWFYFVHLFKHNKPLSIPLWSLEDRMHQCCSNLRGFDTNIQDRKQKTSDLWIETLHILKYSLCGNYPQHP